MAREEAVSKMTTALETVQRFVRRVAADPLDLDDKLGALAALDTIEAELDRTQGIELAIAVAESELTRLRDQVERDDIRAVVETSMRLRAERDEAIAALREIAEYDRGGQPQGQGNLARAALARLSTPKEPEWGPAGPTPYNGTVGD